MSTHIIENVLDLKRLIALFSNRDLPVTVNIKKGKDRTVAQNNYSASGCLKPKRRETVQQKNTEDTVSCILAYLSCVTRTMTSRRHMMK
jgi:hypothetical protein